MAKAGMSPDKIKELSRFISETSLKQAAKVASEVIATRRGYSTKRVKGLPKKIKSHNVDD